MTLQEIIDIIKEIGGLQPNVNSVTEGSIYEVLNTDPSVNYANFHITQNRHQTEDNLIKYNFIFFYTDRLMADKTNKLSIQSIGIEVLSNIIRTLNGEFEDIEIDNTDFQPFTERFSDNCAGVYSTVSISVPVTYTCGETFGNLMGIGSNKCDIRNEFIGVTVTENGRLVVNYNPELYTGIERVTINTDVKPKGLTEIEITENGEYLPDDNYDGYNRVNVNVQPELEDITITENGEYRSDKYGYGTVVVDVPPLSIFDKLNGYNTDDINGVIGATDKNIEYTNNLYDEWDGSKKYMRYPNDKQLVYAPANDATNVANMDQAFQYCTALQYVPYYNTSKVTTMNNMFTGCTALRYVDCSKWDVSNVTNMGNMFTNCALLTELDLSTWDVSKVITMYNMFSGCTALTSVGDLSGWNIKTQSIWSLFAGCKSLKTLNLKGWDLSNIYILPSNNNTAYYNMFRDCKSLVSIDVSNWVISSAETNMGYMFSWCESLTELDLSTWDVSNVSSINSMFYSCYNLTTLNISNWDLNGITNYNKMTNAFQYCENLENLICDNLKLPDINIGIYPELRMCKKLTVESLVGLLNALPVSTNGYTFTLGETNLNKLTDEQKAIAINKGWTLN